MSFREGMTILVLKMFEPSKKTSHRKNSFGHVWSKSLSPTWPLGKEKVG